MSVSSRKIDFSIDSKICYCWHRLHHHLHHHRPLRLYCCHLSMVCRYYYCYPFFVHLPMHLISVHLINSILCPIRRCHYWTQPLHFFDFLPTINDPINLYLFLFLFYVFFFLHPDKLREYNQYLIIFLLFTICGPLEKLFYFYFAANLLITISFQID